MLHVKNSEAEVARESEAVVALRGASREAAKDFLNRILPELIAAGKIFAVDPRNSVRNGPFTIDEFHEKGGGFPLEHLTIPENTVRHNPQLVAIETMNEVLKVDGWQLSLDSCCAPDYLPSKWVIRPFPSKVRAESMGGGTDNW